MSNEEINRKIAVIFASDLVSNSKHMEKDEDAQIFFESKRKSIDTKTFEFMC